MNLPYRLVDQIWERRGIPRPLFGSQDDGNSFIILSGRIASLYRGSKLKQDAISQSIEEAGSLSVVIWRDALEKTIKFGDYTQRLMA